MDVVIERLAGENLPFLTAGLGAYYGLIAASHLYFLTPPAREQMAVIAALSSLALAGLYIASRAGKLANRAHLTIVAMAAIAMGNSLAHLALTADPKQTSNVAIVIVGCGLLFYSRRWLFAFLVGSVILWWLIAQSWPPEAPRVHSLFMLISTGALAILAFRMRMQALESLEGMRAAVGSAELEARLQQLQKAESLGVLASGVAHDLNNVLVGVLGNAELAKRTIPSNSEAIPYLNAVSDAGQRASELARQMLDYSGKGRMVSETVRLPGLLEDMKRLLRSSAGPNIRMDIKVVGAIPPVEGDPGQLKQVIVNLVLNAAEAIGGKPGQILLRLDCLGTPAGFRERPVQGGEAPAGEYVQLTVRDDGCGMDAATQERMFDPFYTTKNTGRGLGLASVSGIVRAHGGVLLVESQREKGTCLTVCLPASEEPVVKAERKSPSEVPTGATILVVDDEAAVRWVAREALRAAGYRVVEAKNGLEALHRMSNTAEAIDLVLLDATMPVMGGLKVLEESAGLPIRTILMSGYGENLAAGRSEQYDSFLHKPFTATDLVEKVRDALAHARPSNEQRPGQ